MPRQIGKGPCRISNPPYKSLHQMLCADGECAQTACLGMPLVHCWGNGVEPPGNHAFCREEPDLNSRVAAWHSIL